MKKTLHTTLRLCFTGLTVVGIGWAFLTLNPPSPSSIALSQEDQAPLSFVRESNADIFGMSFAAPDRTQKFMAALERLGHEPPRSYDANGNTMFFSSAVTHKTPEEVLREYQLEFLNQGLNSDIYTETSVSMFTSSQENALERAWKMVDASMKGEMIPQIVSRDYVAMGGANMLLPEDELQGQEDKQFAHNADVVTSTYERFLSAYKACNGDVQLLNNMIAKQNDDSQSANPQLEDVEALDVRMQKAANTSGSCSDAGGLCSPELQAYNESSHRLTALRKAIEEQPHLQECSQVQTAQRLLVSSTFKDARQRIRALRYIEAIRDQNSQTTSVTAVWSDEDMDPKKFMTETFGYDKSAKVRGDFPVCPGCRRIWNFGGTSTEKDYITDTLVSGDSIGRVSEYYTRELNNQGWQLSDSSHKAAELMQVDGVRTPTRHLHFQRNGKFMTVRIGQDENGQTEILSNTSD